MKEETCNLKFIFNSLHTVMNFYFFFLCKKNVKYLITVKVKINFSPRDSDTGPTILTPH